MKTLAEINAEILNITLTIEQYYPELNKYISEMPFNNHINYNDGISVSNLVDYNNSLKSLVMNYAASHRALIVVQ